MKLRNIEWVALGVGAPAMVVALAVALDAGATRGIAATVVSAQECAAAPASEAVPTRSAVSAVSPAMRMPATGSAGLLGAADVQAPLQECPSPNPATPDASTSTPPAANAMPAPSATPVSSPTSTLPDLQLPGSPGGGGSPDVGLPPGGFY